MDIRAKEIIGEELYNEIEACEKAKVDNEEAHSSLYIHIVPKEINSKHIRDKYYVGITRRKPEVRWKNGTGYRTAQRFSRAIKSHGWDNIEHLVITSKLTQKESEDFQIKIIAKLNTTCEEYGYNLSTGGTGGNRKKTKSCKQYTLMGEFVRSYNTEADAAQALGTSRTCISHACKYHHSACGFQWCYSDQEITCPFIRQNQKAVIQLTMDEKFVAQYPTLKFASELTGFNYSSLQRCLKGRYQYSHGYRWKYKED